MPINFRARLESTTTASTTVSATWTSSLSREDAIRGALTSLGIAGLPNSAALATTVTRYPEWPEIEYYAVQGNPQPSYVWNSTTPAEDETVYFAQAFTLPGISVALERLATAEVFSDNAHTLFIEEYTVVTLPILGTILAVLNTVTPAGGAVDGPESSAGQASEPPFGWQTISKFSEDYTPTLPIDLPGLIGTFFVVSFEATNYLSNGPFNPAGLQYIVELYDDLISLPGL